MPLKNGKVSRVSIKITTSEQVHQHLTTLVGTGLYGASVPEAAEMLILEQLREDLKKVRLKALEGER